MKILCVFRLFSGLASYVKFNKPHTGAVAIYEFLKYLKLNNIDHDCIFFNLVLDKKKKFFPRIKKKNIQIIYCITFIFMNMINLFLLKKF